MSTHFKNIQFIYILQFSVYVRIKGRYDYESKIKLPFQVYYF